MLFLVAGLVFSQQGSPVVETFFTVTLQTGSWNQRRVVKAVAFFSQKLAEESAFHEFCRMLARLKANYQLSELVKVPCYRESIELIAKFTVSSLRHYHFSQNSIHYLLSLWQVSFVRCKIFYKRKRTTSLILPISLLHVTGIVDIFTTVFV